MSDTLNALLDSSAARWPARTALLVEEGRQDERAVSYAELLARVLRAAALLRSRGIRKGDRVALLQRNGLGFVAAYFGLARLGAAAVPINFMIQKPEELRYMLQDCGAKALLTQRAFLREALRAKEGLEGLSTVWVMDGGAAGGEDFWRAAKACAPYDGAGEALEGDTAAVLYTSGTTGKPKGIMLTHANLISNSDAAIRSFQVSQSDVFPCLLPMFHTFAWTACVLVPLRLGARIIVVSSITPPKPWLSRMARHRATIFVAVPQLYALLAKQASGLKRLLLRWWFFRGVRFCVSGAGPLPARVAADFERKLGLRILEGYGLTETSPVVSVNPPQRPRPGSVGPPIEGVRLRIVDDAGRVLPAGQEGEICVAGPAVMKGYFGRPGETREVLSEDGWLKTGDIGLLDAEGYLYVRDRKKDMIIVKGLKVFPAQVEEEILSHPDVGEAAVVGVPDEAGDEIVKAYVVLKPGASADKAALMRHCRRRLDAYKRPRDLEIVAELPKNSLQKVLKRLLREQAIQKSGGLR